MNWLDTQTKEILQKEHDSKLSPPKVAEFALVLVRKGQDQDRMVHAVSEINYFSGVGRHWSGELPTPITINPSNPRANLVLDK